MDGVRNPLDLPGVQDWHFRKLRQLGIAFLAAAGLRTDSAGVDRIDLLRRSIVLRV